MILRNPSCLWNLCSAFCFSVLSFGIFVLYSLFWSSTFRLGLLECIWIALGFYFGLLILYSDFWVLYSDFLVFSFRFMLWAKQLTFWPRPLLQRRIPPTNSPTALAIFHWILKTILRCACTVFSFFGLEWYFIIRFVLSYWCVVLH